MKEQRIYKYKLDLTDNQNIGLPSGYEILCVQIQNGIPCIWAMVDPSAQERSVHIEIFGTGHPILSDMGTARNYIGTIQYNGLVFHVFEYTGI